MQNKLINKSKKSLSPPHPHPSLSSSLFEVSSWFHLAYLCKTHPVKHLLSPWDSCTMYGSFLFLNACNTHVIKPGSEAPAIWPLPIFLKFLLCHTASPLPAEYNELFLSAWGRYYPAQPAWSLVGTTHFGDCNPPLEGFSVGYTQMPD